MWGEWVPTVKSMENKIYPRFSAYAEIGWTSLARKDFKNFKERMKEQTRRWDLLGIQYASNQVNVLTASDFFNHVKIGSWNPQTVKQSYKTLEFDATAQIQAKGTYEAALLYKKGTHAINIQSVELYENNKKISEDKHIGFSGGSLKDVAYKLIVKSFKKSAKYTIKITLKGSGGHDSHGEVKLLAK